LLEKTLTTFISDCHPKRFALDLKHHLNSQDIDVDNAATTIIIVYGSILPPSSNNWADFVG
jgi:hypothetical protein